MCCTGVTLIHINAGNILEFVARAAPDGRTADLWVALEARRACLALVFVLSRVRQALCGTFMGSTRVKATVARVSDRARRAGSTGKALRSPGNNATLCGAWVRLTCATSV